MESTNTRSPSREVYIIGTSHKPIDATYAQELENLFECINPNQILLEKEPIELAREQFKDNRPEMEFAYEWAKSRRVSVKAFDCNNNVVKSNISENELAKANERMNEITNTYGWMELNRPENIRQFESILLSVLDMKKHHRREARMLATINRKMRKRGRVLILTGTYHLLFFRRQFPDAFFLEDVIQN